MVTWYAVLTDPQGSLHHPYERSFFRNQLRIRLALGIPALSAWLCSTALFPDQNPTVRLRPDVRHGADRHIPDPAQASLRITRMCWPPCQLRFKISNHSVVRSGLGTRRLCIMMDEVGCEGEAAHSRTRLNRIKAECCHCIVEKAHFTITKRTPDSVWI